MTMQRYEDCRCEDYPCCGHYDILHGDEGMPEWCDRCGVNHSPFRDCMEDEFDDDDETDDDSDLAARYYDYVAMDWGYGEWITNEDDFIVVGYSTQEDY